MLRRIGNDMMKKIYIILSIVITLLIGYKGYSLYNNCMEINRLEKKISDKSSVDDKYSMVLDSIINEVGDFDNIEDEVILLENRYNENEDKLKTLEGNLESILSENTSVENRIVIRAAEIKERDSKKLIGGNYVYNQFPNYPTGCESVALYLLLKYNGVSTTVDDIVDNLKKGDMPYLVGSTYYGSDPEEVFVGDPRSSYSYGVYNKPLVEVANMYKSGINSRIGLGFDDMLSLVKGNKPVLVWVSINLNKSYVSSTWVDKDSGRTIKWLAGEHAVVVIGYDSENVIVSDPYTGSIRYFNKEVFKDRYNYFGRRAMYY